MKTQEQLVSEFAWRVVEGMDMQTLEMYAMEKIVADYSTLSEEDLHAEIAEFYPDLLEDVDADDDIY